MKRYYSVSEINSAVKNDAAEFVGECINEYENRIKNKKRNLEDIRIWVKNQRKYGHYLVEL